MCQIFSCYSYVDSPLVLPRVLDCVSIRCVCWNTFTFLFRHMTIIVCRFVRCMPLPLALFHMMSCVKCNNFTCNSFLSLGHIFTFKYTTTKRISSLFSLSFCFVHIRFTHRSSNVICMEIRHCLSTYFIVFNQHIVVY